jgi:hypothetical protein
MSLEIKSVIIVIAYAIISNLVMFSYANMGIGITCYREENEFDINTTINYTDGSDTNLIEVRSNIFNVALDRCNGFPAWLFWVLEVPVIIGIIYIIRGFVGLT